MSNVQTIVMLPTNNLHPRSWNPNEMSDAKFNQLCDKIDEEGFTDPIKVALATEDDVKREGWTPGVHYWIWAGEHRWRYARLRDMETVPCVVYEGEEWDEAAQKLKMVRDNLVHGELNAKKFTALVASLDPNFDIDPTLLGFSDSAEMDKFIIREKTEREKSFLDGLMDVANQKKEAVDSLSDIVANIFQECAATVDQSYLHFTWKGNVHCVILCNDKTRKQVEGMMERLHSTGENINDFMEAAIRNQLQVP